MYYSKYEITYRSTCELTYNKLIAQVSRKNQMDTLRGEG